MRGRKLPPPAERAEVVRLFMAERGLDEGLLHTEEFLNWSSDPAAPSHDYFDWDDSVAGRRWRLEQARRYLSIQLRAEDFPVTRGDDTPVEVEIESVPVGGGTVEVHAAPEIEIVYPPPSRAVTPMLVAPVHLRSRGGGRVEGASREGGDALLAEAEMTLREWDDRYGAAYSAQWGRHVYQRLQAAAEHVREAVALLASG